MQAVDGQAGPAGRFRHELHLFRAVAIILILLTHSLPSFDWAEAPLTGRILTELCHQTSALFFFISGYLFQHLSGRFSYRRYLHRKLKTVILPYAVVSVPAIIVSVWFVPQEGIWPWFYDLPKWVQVVLFYLTGKHLEPLWFVPTVAIFYLAAPLFIAVDRRPRLYLLILPLLAIAVAFGREGPLGPLNKAVYFLPVYLFGMAFSRFRAEAEAIGWRGFWALAALFTGLTAYAVIEQPKTPDVHILAKLALSCMMIVLLTRHAPRRTPFLDHVAHVSFSIYFIHAYAISAFRLALTLAGDTAWHGAESTALFAPSLALVAAHTVLVLGVSLAIIWLVQHLFPRDSIWLIGARTSHMAAKGAPPATAVLRRAEARLRPIRSPMSTDRVE